MKKKIKNSISYYLAYTYMENIFINYIKIYESKLLLIAYILACDICKTCMKNILYELRM